MMTLASSTKSPPPTTSAILHLTESAQRGELVVVIGSGVSIALTNNNIPALSWQGLIADGLEEGLQRGNIDPVQKERWTACSRSSDLDELLGAAEFMGRKLGAPMGDLYARWLERVFANVMPLENQMAEAVRTLHQAGIPLSTLNYDTLLERVTGLPTITLTDQKKMTGWMRREEPAILHLHGVWDCPETCILGIRDYQATQGDDIRDLLQRSLGSFKRLLFIGCGDTFGDPNFAALVQWMRMHMKAAAPQHYALVEEKEVARRRADKTWQGYVDPISYGIGYTALPDFLLKHFRTNSTIAESIIVESARSQQASEAVVHARLLDDYRKFLLRDCGQMTIEGVRADMDTASRRFDLERLFVPLELVGYHQRSDLGDLTADTPMAGIESPTVGKILRKAKYLVLLALPGGGKTLLLKRLAVSYADPARRASSSDDLPDLDLMPIMIRCREWREYIRQPISTLLLNLPAITGQANLVGLFEALKPCLQDGRALLLVDGLDEIHDNADRSIFVEHLEAFLEQYPNARVVVTSREAGFNLVAPRLIRFCKLCVIGALNTAAIIALCTRWENLMSGESADSVAEGRAVAARLLGNSSLRRLAESPLLLTMLLVVKRGGGGRLPLDRVSLYGRAVEVLLDTWNIKGHAPLNPKEAVPQLACVAYEMMRLGQQTATEKELLTLLEAAYDNLPQVARYAQDKPDAFLKRVELRSSLLVEAGHQDESGAVVPFYQFRHLTFQEYLAALAVTEGYYLSYKKTDSVLTPLNSYLSDVAWKEVVPMAAALARKRAEPLMAELVREGNRLRSGLEGNQTFVGHREWNRHPSELPTPVARLVQCLVEEAEATPETLGAALQLVLIFAKGCRRIAHWPTLVVGPYGSELLQQAWLLYAPMRWPIETELDYSYARFVGWRHIAMYGLNDVGGAELQRLLTQTSSDEEIVCGCLICVGLLMNTPEEQKNAVLAVIPIHDIECHLFQNKPATSYTAVWAWGEIRSRQVASARPAPKVLDRILRLWLGPPKHKVWDLLTFQPDACREYDANKAAFALATAFGLPRAHWAPILTKEQIKKVRQVVDAAAEKHNNVVIASVMLGFHAQTVWSEQELARCLKELMGGDTVIAPQYEEDANTGVDTLFAQQRIQADYASTYMHENQSETDLIDIEQARLTDDEEIAAINALINLQKRGKVPSQPQAVTVVPVVTDKQQRQTIYAMLVEMGEAGHSYL